VLPYDPAGYERAYNAYHACEPGTEHQGEACPCAAADDECGDRFALWPGPVIAYEDNAGIERGLLLYTELYVHPGDFRYTIRGTSIARWDDPRRPARRTAIALFGPDDPSMFAGAIMDRASWLFYIGGDPNAATSWDASPARAVRVLEASTTISLQRNKYLGALTTMYSQFLTHDIFLQTAARPEGPWSGHPSAPLFNVGPIERLPDYYGLAHAEYDASFGRRIYVSTSHPDRDDIYRMPTRLFEVTLRR
jgi:hypothetical protein